MSLPREALDADDAHAHGREGAGAATPDALAPSTQAVESSASAPPPIAPPARSLPAAPARNTVADTWGWLWKDTLTRLAPFTAGVALYARLAGGPHTVGLRADTWRRDLALGVALGLPLAGLAAAFRGWVAPGYRLPTAADQSLQSFYYLGMNAPIEELFWRGVTQTLVIRGLAALPGVKRSAPALGWGLTTAAFGAYHRLGAWSWRAIAGVTAAGGLFGAAYLLPRRRSIVLPALIHGFATAGFLSWGDLALHLTRRLRTG